MNQTVKRWVAVVCLLGAYGIPKAWAGPGDQGAILALTMENDSHSNPFNRKDRQDRHYTQGFKFTYVGSDDYLNNVTTAVSRVLPELGIRTSARKFGYVFGQNIYTPDDLRVSTLITNDRPYAGWLYVGTVLQRRGETAGAIPVMESFELDIGIIGKESLAEFAQTMVHRWGDDAPPQGWDNQLKTEPGLQIRYGRLWRLTPNEDTARFFDVIPHAGVSLGNVMTWGELGSTLRVGWNLPEDFGPQLNDSPATVNGGLTATTASWGFYGFGRVAGRAVGHNIFLDGNTFRSSHSVEKEPFVADLSWGFAFQVTKHVEVSYTRIIRTNEFEGQKGNDVFGSFMVKGRFDF